jgi:hypothetical protein
MVVNSVQNIFTTSGLGLEQAVAIRRVWDVDITINSVKGCDGGAGIASIAELLRDKHIK